MMTGPEQVPVNLADLEKALFWGDLSAVARLKHVIPVPKWEPTDDMRAQYRRAYNAVHDDNKLEPAPDGDIEYIDNCLQAMHREGLL